MVKPELLTWARERVDYSLKEAEQAISTNYGNWENGKGEPTIKQLETIAHKFYVPFGYLFLDQPPQERLPISDFRIIGNQHPKRPSPNLLETIYDAQRKQAWLKEQKIEDEEGRVFELMPRTTEEQIVSVINELLSIETLRDRANTYDVFLNSLIKKLHEREFLVIRNSVVGNNTHRALDSNEFRGFALFDEYAPLIFINGKDYKAAQIFTLVHELAHLFLGETGLDADYHLKVEQKCNQIAGEVLLPESALKAIFKKGDKLDKLDKIAKHYKVSKFVPLIKARQCNLINQATFGEKWDHFIEALAKSSRQSKGGGQFYNNVKYRAGGDKFILKVIHSTLAGRTLYKDAYSLTGLNSKSFNEYCRKEGIML